MTRRPTIRDIADAAGVGAATVDRALNGRGNVSPRTAAAIAEAARRIGYTLAGSALGEGMEERPAVTLGFVLHKSGQTFYRDFARELERACDGFPSASVTADVRFSPSQAPEDFAAFIAGIAESAGAVASTAVNHATLTRLAERLRDEGRPVFALLNDFAGRAGAGYFGLDNMKAGRIAGWTMAMALQRPCRVAVFVGGSRWHGQALRETGFRSALRDHAPQIEVADTVVNLETRQVTYEATLDLLQRHGDLAGLYVAGGGMEGAIAALRETRPPGKVALIVNELTPESRAALADRYALMVIATPLTELCRDLVDRMVPAAVGISAPAQGAVLFEPRIYLPESV